jgi:hypothetical protein
MNERLERLEGLKGRGVSMYVVHFVGESREMDGQKNKKAKKSQ